MDINDNVLALCELSNDLLFHKIPRQQYLYYIQNSLDIGRKAARKFKGANIYDLYKENCIKIEYFEEHNAYYGVNFRGQVSMDRKEVKVGLYRESIKELAVNSGYLGKKPIDYEMALKIHLSHEFFHFLEFENNEFVSDILDSIDIIKFVFFKREARINRTSEIAAHAFVKEMLGLSHLPNIYDYIYLVNSGKMTFSNFEKMIIRLNDIISY